MMKLEVELERTKSEKLSLAMFCEKNKTFCHILIGSGEVMMQE